MILLFSDTSLSQHSTFISIRHTKLLQIFNFFNVNIATRFWRRYINQVDANCSSISGMVQDLILKFIHLNFSEVLERRQIWVIRYKAEKCHTCSYVVFINKKTTVLPILLQKALQQGNHILVCSKFEKVCNINSIHKKRRMYVQCS